jgi:Phage portal protein
MSSRHLYIDGQKASPLDVWGDTGWVPMGAPLSWGDVDRFELVKRVGILYRAIKIRSQSILEVPWEISKNDEVIWSDGDDEAPEELQWFSNWPELLSLTETSLVMTSQAFWGKERNRFVLKGYKWFSPKTMLPRWDKNQGLVGFYRYLSTGDPIPLGLDDVVYIWYRNALEETAPEISPLQAAERDSQVLDHLNLFVSTYFERGAVKATILTVEGNPVQAERDKLKAWWESALTGIRKAFSTEVISASVKPITVGEGVKELSNNDLSREKREDLVSTLGVPLSKIFSNAANYATAELDNRSFFQNTIIPDCKLIQAVVNRELRKTGYKLRFTPETMDIFQEDETRRAESYSKYTAAGMKPSIAAEILGLELPQGIEYSDLDPQPAGPLPSAGSFLDGEEEEEEESEEIVKALEDLEKYKRKVLKRLSAGKSASCSFESEHVPGAILSDLEFQLEAADRSAVQKLFAPETLKAMLLQLDPDDEEAEWERKGVLENRAARNIASALGDFRDGLYAESEPTSAESEKERVIREFQTNQGIRDSVGRMLMDSVDEGVQVVSEQFEAIGLGLDWDVPNTAARIWAQNHLPVLMEQLAITSGEAVGAAVANWIQNGEPLSALIEDLSRTFGKVRARNIAITEVTRAFTQGNLASWAAAGYDGSPTVLSPLHVRCRCVITLRINDDGSADFLWRTAFDERVCPQCGPLRNTVVGRARSAN